MSEVQKIQVAVRLTEFTWKLTPLFASMNNQA